MSMKSLRSQKSLTTKSMYESVASNRQSNKLNANLNDWKPYQQQNEQTTHLTKATLSKANLSKASLSKASLPGRPRLV